MKLRSITYDETSDDPAEITVTMTLAELAAIHAIAGKLNDRGQRRLGLGDDDSLYDVPSQVLCMHYDDGRAPNGPRLASLAELATINDPAS